jgi:hypothetical protein
MTYRRVIPRDLFNEANLLKCLGRLSLLLLDHPIYGRAEFRHNGEPFLIEQDEADGSISVPSLRFLIDGEPVHLSRPLNSRDSWPLWAQVGEDEVQVFDEDGKLTPEFASLIKRELGR